MNGGRRRRTVLWAVAAIAAVAVVLLLPAEGPRLRDLTAAHPPAGVRVVQSPGRLLLEPLAGLAELFFSFTDHRAQGKAWLIWTGLAAAAWGIVRRRSLPRLLLGVLAAWVGFLSLLVLLLALPLPSVSLEAPPGWLRVDFHSHTDISHDGVAGPAASLRYHRRLGFDRFFATEHSTASGYDRFGEAARRGLVLPGIQVRTDEGLSLLVLADRPFPAHWFTHSSAQEVIARAHRERFLVIVPHWWRGRRVDWESLAAWGVDGFEIFDTAYRRFSDEERKRLVDFCRERGLMMMGSTDWHGWGALGDVWTLVPLPPGPSPDAAGLLALLRGRPPLRVVNWRQPPPYFGESSFLEPPVALLRYFARLDAAQAGVWALWLIGAWALAATGAAARLRRPASLGVSLAFLTAAGWQTLWWLTWPQNEIALEALVPLYGALGACWLLAWYIAPRRGTRRLRLP